MERDIEVVITDFLAKKSGRRRAQITPGSELLRDLGIYGDDAAEVMTWFAERFEIDMRNFEFVRHFCSEPNLFSIFKRPSVRTRELRAKIPVTVRDMVKAAEAHRWISPVTPSEPEQA